MTRQDTAEETVDCDCFLTSCGEPATTWIGHPDRGTVPTCGYHARKIAEVERSARATRPDGEGEL